MVDHSGRSGGVMFSQFRPPSREMWTRPSSEPAQKTPGSWGDSTKANIVPKFSHEGSVLRNRPPGRLHLRSVVARQVGADGLPAVPLVRGTEHGLGGHVERPGVVRRKDDGIRPLEAILVILHALPVHELRPHRDDLALASLVVIAVQGVAAARRAADSAGKHHVGVVGMNRDLPTLRASDEVAVGIEDGTLFEVAAGAC